MENFNNVPSSGTFGSVVSVVNQNFALAKEAIDKLAFSKSACMGFYETSSELNDAHPTPTDGDWALVGNSSPFNVYVANDGSWVDSGVDYTISVDVDIVDNLTDGGNNKALSAEMGKVLGNALKTNGTLMSIRAYSQEQFDALQTLEDNTIYLIGILGGFVNVSSTLTNCTNGNQATKTLFGDPYNATLVADTGYEISTVIVYMNNVDVTSQVYSGGVISIASVDGDIAITATATRASLPVMRSLGVWLDVTDNLNDGTYHSDATKWVSKVSCGTLGNIEFNLLGEVSFVDGVARFAPTNTQESTSIYGTNPLCADGLGEIGSGDVTIEIVLNSQFTRHTDAGDSIFFVGVNHNSMPVGRWRFGLYTQNTKNLDIWCNDGKGKFATLANSTPSAGKQTLCFVRQNGVVTYYRNGAYVGSVTPETQTFSTSSTVYLCVGNQSNGVSNNCLTGDVYDVKVYGRALTAEEVAFNHDFNNTHYNLGL